MAKQGVQSIIINDWKGGLYSHYYEDRPHTALFFGKDQYAQGYINPIALPGLLMPAVDTFTTLTNASETGNVIQRFVAYDDATPNYYAIENATKLHEIVISSDTMTTSFHTISAHGGHSSVVGEDVEFYQVNGSTRLFYSWNDNTDGDVGTYIIGGAFDDDFLSTTPVSAAALGKFPHPLLRAPNNFLYIADGPSIHKFGGTSSDGANGTFYPTAIDMTKGYVIQDWVHAQSYAWIAGVQSVGGTIGSTLMRRRCSVFVWNYISILAGNQTGFSAVIPVDGESSIDNIFLFQGVPHIFTRGADNKVRLRYWNGQEFAVRREMDINARPANRGAIDIYKNLLLWQTVDGRWMAFGSIGVGYPEGLFVLAKEGTVGGAIVGGASGYYYGSMYDSTYTVKKMNFPTDSSSSNAYSGTITVDNYRSGVYQLPGLSEIVGMNIYWPPFSGGADSDMTINLYVNQAQSATKSFSVNNSSDGSKGFKYIPYVTKNVNQIQIGVTWPAAAVNKSILPSRIEILYRTTEKIQ